MEVKPVQLYHQEGEEMRENGQPREGMGRLLYRPKECTIELPGRPGGVGIVACGSYKVPEISPGQTPLIGPDF